MFLAWYLYTKLVSNWLTVGQYLMDHRWTAAHMCGADPPENCQLNVKIIDKNLTFFSKKLTKIFIFFNKIANGNFVEKNENFCQFFWKKCLVFGNFLTVKWQFSGGSGRYSAICLYGHPLGRETGVYIGKGYIGKRGSNQ